MHPERDWKWNTVSDHDREELLSLIIYENGLVTSIVCTTYSDNKAMIKVIQTNQMNPLQNPITAASSAPSSSSSDS